MTPTKVKMKSDSDNDSLNSFKSNRSSRSDRITQLEEEFKSMKKEFNEKSDKLFNCLEALNLSKKDDTVIIDESKNSVSTRADDPNQIIRNTNTPSQIRQYHPQYMSINGGRRRKRKRKHFLNYTFFFFFFVRVKFVIGMFSNLV